MRDVDRGREREEERPCYTNLPTSNKLQLSCFKDFKTVFLNEIYSFDFCPVRAELGFMSLVFKLTILHFWCNLASMVLGSFDSPVTFHPWYLFTINTAIM